MTAVLFADPAPAKIAVSLHQTGQKGALGPASQAACHEARRPRPRTQDSVQAPSLTDRLLAWRSANTHAPACLPSGEKWRDVWNLQASSSASGWRAGPRHLIDTKPHLVFKLGWKEPGGTIPWGPHAFKNFKGLPISLHSQRLKLSCVPRGGQAPSRQVPSTPLCHRGGQGS